MTGIEGAILCMQGGWLCAISWGIFKMLLDIKYEIRGKHDERR